jgi:Fe-S cluster assembly protein SufD
MRGLSVRAREASVTSLDIAHPLIADHAGVKNRLPGARLRWLDDLRERGAAAFTASGLPTRKLEAWKYTDLRAVERTAFVLAGAYSDRSPVDQVPTLFKIDDVAARLVFVDGRFRPELSRYDRLPAGVVLEDLATALRDRPAVLEAHFDEANGGQPNALAARPLLALNTAYMDDGFVLLVPRGVVVEAPIEIVTLGGLAEVSIAHHPRSLIDVEDGGAATVVEHTVGGGEGATFTNSALDVRVGPRGLLRHYRVQADGPAAFGVASVRVTVAEDAGYEAFSLATGGRISRLDARVTLDGRGARCGLSGAFLMRGKQHCDNTTVIEHRVPGTSCREVFKGVLDGQARGVFQGRIVVHRDAQKTDGHQSCKTLLLTDTAEIDAKPELEIYADDVKCSHGATAGQLNADALFYLRCRGIDEATARRLLIEAFVAGAFDEVSWMPMRTIFADLVEAWMKTKGKEAE